ncbi:MAG: hypothetical protein ACXVRQ_07410, partial [Gaiellaceae bacterium]
MRRIEVGRDFGLSVRMLIVAGILVAIYLTLFAGAVGAAVAIHDRRMWFLPLLVVLGIFAHYQGA